MHRLERVVRAALRRDGSRVLARNARWVAEVRGTRSVQDEWFAGSPWGPRPAGH